MTTESQKHITRNSASRYQNVDASPTGLAEVSRSFQMTRWLPWGLLAIFGVILMIYGGVSSQKHQNGISKTALLIADVQVGVQAFGSEAILAARGNPGSIDNLRNWRNKINSSLDLLSKGGSVNGVKVVQLSGPSAMTLKKVKDDFKNLDGQVASLEETGSILRDSSSADSNLDIAIGNINKLLNAMERNQDFRSGSSLSNELAQIKNVLTRPEMRNLKVIFSPIPGADTLQASWAKQFASTSSQLKDLNNRVSASSVNGASKMIVNDLALSVELLANSTEILKNAQASRVAAQQLQVPLQNSLSQIQKPLTDLGSQVILMQDEMPWNFYIFVLGLVMGASGIFALVRSAMTLSQDHWTVTQESRSSHGLGLQVDRQTRTFKRILESDQKGGQTKLEEDPDSQLYGFITLINSTLEKNYLLKEHIQKLIDSFSLLVGDLNSRSSNITLSTERSDENMSKISQAAMSVARELAELTNFGVHSDAENLEKMVLEAEILMSDGQLKMDELREQVQSTSKQLKRLAENIQNINNYIKMIDGVSREINMLAMNAAIEASAHGESGRRFAVISKDIERLSLSTKSISEDIKRVVDVIQVDTQETVAAMELSTAEVVLSAELNSKTSSSLREMEAFTYKLKESLAKMLKVLGKQAVLSAKVSTTCDESVVVIKEVKDSAQKITSSSERLKILVKENKIG